MTDSGNASDSSSLNALPSLDVVAFQLEMNHLDLRDNADKTTMMGSNKYLRLEYAMDHAANE